LGGHSTGVEHNDIKTARRGVFVNKIQSQAMVQGGTLARYTIANEIGAEWHIGQTERHQNRGIWFDLTKKKG